LKLSKKKGFGRKFASSEALGIQFAKRELARFCSPVSGKPLIQEEKEQEHRRNE
jgi:hypothetical protein